MIGYPWGSWYYYDALHCRTRDLRSPMLRITHGRLAAWVPDQAGHEVTALIDDRSEAGLVLDSLRVYWRPAGSVEYYLAADDESGRSETLPRSAPDGLYAFTVGCEPLMLTVGKTELAWNPPDGAVGYAFPGFALRRAAQERGVS